MIISAGERGVLLPNYSETLPLCQRAGSSDLDPVQFHLSIPPLLLPLPPTGPEYVSTTRFSALKCWWTRQKLPMHPEGSADRQVPGTFARGGRKGHCPSPPLLSRFQHRPQAQSRGCQTRRLRLSCCLDLGLRVPMTLATSKSTARKGTAV